MFTRRLTKDSGRGMLLYIKNNIQYQKLDIFSITNTNPSDIIALELVLKENIILVCVYRSPNSTYGDSNNISKSSKILLRHFSLNLLVVGDFNYPKIDWEHSKTSGPNDLNCQFFECTKDCFWRLFQNLLMVGDRLNQY